MEHWLRPFGWGYLIGYPGSGLIISAVFPFLKYIIIVIANGPIVILLLKRFLQPILILVV